MDLKSDVLTLQNQCPKVNPSVSKISLPLQSLLREISRQGLFSRGKSIPAQRIPLSGIILPRRKHPCSKEFPTRDYFPEAKASLLGEIPRQGLFSRGGCIPARGNLPSGIIFPRRKHPCLEKFPVRDYFPEADASLLEEIPRQGLFSRGGCILQ